MTPVGSTARFDLGRRVDVGWLAGLPGTVPLRLQDQVFTAVVADPHEAIKTCTPPGCRAPASWAMAKPKYPLPVGRAIQVS